MWQEGHPFLYICALQGDATAAWTGSNMVVVLFPTAASMDRCKRDARGRFVLHMCLPLGTFPHRARLKALVKKDGGPGLLVVVNPQWETKGLMFGQSGEVVRRVAAGHSRFSSRPRLRPPVLRVLQTSGLGRGEPRARR